VNVRVVVVEWDGAPAEEADRKWVVREFDGSYVGEGFIAAASQVDTLGGSWSVFYAREFFAPSLAAWLNAREGRA
jgi:hypothetical protein